MYTDTVSVYYGLHYWFCILILYRFTMDFITDIVYFVHGFSILITGLFYRGYCPLLLLNCIHPKYTPKPTSGWIPHHVINYIPAISASIRRRSRWSFWSVTLAWNTQDVQIACGLIPMCTFQWANDSTTMNCDILW